MSRKKEWLMAGAVLLLASAVSASEPGGSPELKTWQFQAAGGRAVTVGLKSQLSSSDGLPIYTLQIRCAKVCPKAADEAPLLRSVVRDMESLGWSPQRIGRILLEAREPEVSERLARAAYSSKAWAGASETNSGEIVAALLNSSGAYRAFKPVFDPHGLAVEVAYAESLSFTSPARLGLDPRVVREVPSGATIEIALRPMRSN